MRQVRAIVDTRRHPARHPIDCLSVVCWSSLGQSGDRFRNLSDPGPCPTPKSDRVRWRSPMEKSQYRLGGRPLRGTSVFDRDRSLRGVFCSRSCI